MPDLAVRSGLSADAVGRLRTDETLTSVDDPCIVAVEDAAAPSDLPFRMSCQAASRIGAHAADTVLSRIAGEQPAPISLGFSASASASGVALASSSSPPGTTTRTGTTSAADLARESKEFVCKLSLKHLADEAREPGSLTWVKDDRRRQLLQARLGEAPATPERAA